MKSKFIIPVLLILIINSAFGQSFSGGLNAGFLISQVDGDQGGGYHKGFATGGAYVRTIVGEKQRAMFSLGLYYRQKGSKRVNKDNAGDIIEYYRIRLDYIELPLTFSYQIKAFKIPKVVDYELKNRLNLDLGVSYGYLLHSEIDEGYGAMDPYVIGRPFKKSEFAWHIGLSYYFTEHWFFNYKFSYTFHMLPIRPHPGGQVYRFNRGQYNNVMIFSIGYEF